MPSSVVLPEPDAPTTATLSPALISRSTAAKITSSSAAPSLVGNDLGNATRNENGFGHRDVMALLLLAVSAALQPRRPRSRPRPYLVIGDSISAGYGIQRDQGWVASARSARRHAAAAAPVVNASISGDTTGGGLARLPRALEIHKPDVVVIELGGNDALRGYPIDIDRKQSRRDGRHWPKMRAPSVLVLGMEIPPNYGARYTQAFHAIYADVAKRTGATLVPFLLDGVATDDGADAGRRHSPDRCGATAAARQRLADVEVAAVMRCDAGELTTMRARPLDPRLAWTPPTHRRPRPTPRYNLILSALELFAENGIDAVSMRTINNAAGTQKRIRRALPLRQQARHHRSDHRVHSRGTRHVAARRADRAGDGACATANGRAAAKSCGPHSRRTTGSTTRPEYGQHALRFLARLQIDMSPEIQEILNRDTQQIAHRFDALLARALPDLPDNIRRMRYLYFWTLTVQMFAGSGHLDSTGLRRPAHLRRRRSAAALLRLSRRRHGRSGFRDALPGDGCNGTCGGVVRTFDHRTPALPANTNLRRTRPRATTNSPCGRRRRRRSIPSCNATHPTPAAATGRRDR